MDSRGAELIGEFEDVGAVADIPADGVLALTTSRGEEICLLACRGQVTAVEDRCPHADFPLSDGQLLPNGVLECVWHGAQFDCATGAVIRGPAETPAPRYEVRVRDGRVLVGPRIDPPSEP